MPDRQPLYSVSAAARYLRRTRRTVERLANAGVLRPVPVVTDTEAQQRAPRLFTRADLDRVLSDRESANAGRDLPEPTTKDSSHDTEPCAATCPNTTADRHAG